MILIIGGAYQGKLEYAKQNLNIDEQDVFLCSGETIDFSKACIYRLEDFTYACIQKGMDPIAYFRSHRQAWQNSVLICQDIFCGVVPLEQTNRVWRQSTGRLCRYLSSEAEQVIRIFCGLEHRLK